MILKLKHYFDRAQEIVISLTLLVMSIVVLWQVITRFVLNDPSSWSEELARYCMVWLAFLGGAICVRLSSHMCINLFVEKINNARKRAIVTIIGFLFCILMGVILMIYGYEFMKEGSNQISTALGIKMSYVYSVIPLSGLIITINSIEHICYVFIDNFTAIKRMKGSQEKFTVLE